MEKWRDYNLIEVNIELIDHFVLRDSVLDIWVVDKEKTKWCLMFVAACDFRSVEKNEIKSKNSGVYLEDNSKFFKKRHKLSSSDEKLKRFLILDKEGAGIEVLTTTEPFWGKLADEVRSDDTLTEKWTAYRKLNVDFECIDCIAVGIQEVTIYLTDKKKRNGNYILKVFGI
jgi:hypothetical protein